MDEGINCGLRFTFDFLMHFKEIFKVETNDDVVSNHICQRYQKQLPVLLESTSEIHFNVPRSKGDNLSIQKLGKSIERLPINQSNCSAAISALTPIKSNMYYGLKVF